MTGRRREAGPIQNPTTGTWEFVVDVGLDEHGKRKQHRRRGIKTRAAAQRELNRLRASVQEGTYVERDRVTVREYLARWLDARAVAGLRPNTISSYRRTIALHVTPHLGGRRLQALTSLDLDALYAKLLTDGARNDGKEGALSHRSVRYVHVIISKALNDAERKGLVVRNVARTASPPSAKSAQPKRTGRAWTAADLRAFLDSVRGDRFFAMLRLLAFTGMRRGEACGLRWHDVDLDAGRVTIANTITSDGYQLLHGEPKTDRGHRSIDIDPETIAVLRGWKATQAAERLALGVGWQDRLGLVFTRPDGTPVHPNTVGKVFDARVRKGAFPKIRLHDLRHLHASLLLDRGANPKMVSERLGHASVGFTLDTYAHVMPGQQADAAAAVAALVDG